MSRARLRWVASVAFGVALIAVGFATRTARGGDDKPAGVAVETVKIPTARGVALEASLHKPAKPNGIAVAMAPGQGGGRERPVVKKTSEALATAGFTVVRFDWAYFTAKKQPAEDLAPEAADLDAACDYAKKLPGVTKVIVAGKSLGTMAAVKRIEAGRDDAAALLLLTLPLTMGDPAGTARDGMEPLQRTKIPTVVVAGDRDPLCPLPMLYEFAAKCETPPRVVVVPGDHSLAKAKGDESETDENVSLCAAAAVLWARRLVTP